MRTSVIIPAYNADDTLDRCLAAVWASEQPPDQLIVVDDGSDQPIPGALRIPVRGGPGRARNLGAQHANGDVLIFLDADVLIRPDTLALLTAQLAQESGLGAVQTVYDTACEVPGFASQFQNLLQHWNVTRAAGADFHGLSSYCVAIRRAAFDAAGGFDEQVGRATVEDDNLGQALNAAGWPVRVASRIRVSHLARFTRRRLFGRMRAMAEDKVRSLRRQPRLANVPPHRTHHRPAFLFAAAAVPAALALLPVAPLVSVGLFGAVVVLHLPFAAFLAEEKNCLFALEGTAMMCALALAAAAGAMTGVLS